MYNMHEKAWHRLLLSREALPCQSQTPPTLSPRFLHTPSSPGYAFLCSIIPSSLVTPPLPPPPLGMLSLRHHPSSPGYASFCSPTSPSFGYASLCSITPLASPVGTLPPALLPPSPPVGTFPSAPVDTVPSAPSPPSPVDTLPSAPSPLPLLGMLLGMLPSAQPWIRFPLLACHRTGHFQTWRP